MPDKEHTSLPFESNDPAEQRLWAALGELPQGEPSAELRSRFYSSLHEAGKPRWTERLAHWLGVGANRGWITAAACLVLGFGIAQVIEPPAAESPRLAALEEGLAHVQRELVLDRLQDASANTRLRGIVEAGQSVSHDPLVTQALFDRASSDPSLSVRSAAIDALGARLDSSDVGAGLMRMLEGAESPIVELSLIDLFLRHGDAEQLRALKTLADSGRLHPDLARHVNSSLGSQSI